MRRKSAYSHIAKVNQSAQRFTSNMATMINCRSTRGLRNRERFRKELRTSFRGCFSPNSQFAFLKFFQCIHNHDTGDASTTTRLGERERTVDREGRTARRLECPKGSKGSKARVRTTPGHAQARDARPRPAIATFERARSEMEN